MTHIFCVQTTEDSSCERQPGIFIVELFPLKSTEERILTIEFLPECLLFPSRRRMREFKDWSESFDEFSQAVLRSVTLLSLDRVFLYGTHSELMKCYSLLLQECSSICTYSLLSLNVSYDF